MYEANSNAPQKGSKASEMSNLYFFDCHCHQMPLRHSPSVTVTELYNSLLLGFVSSCSSDLSRRGTASVSLIQLDLMVYSSFIGRPRTRYIFRKLRLEAYMRRQMSEHSGSSLRCPFLIASLIISRFPS